MNSCVNPFQVLHNFSDSDTESEDSTFRELGDRIIDSPETPPPDLNPDILDELFDELPEDEWNRVISRRNQRFADSVRINPRVICGKCDKIWQIKRNTPLSRKVLIKAFQTGKLWRINEWECIDCYQVFEETLSRVRGECTSDDQVKDRIYDFLGYRLTEEILDKIQLAAETRGYVYIKRIISPEEIELRRKVCRQWDLVDRLTIQQSERLEAESLKLNKLRDELRELRESSTEPH